MHSVACVAVTREGGAWATSRRWSSRQMKPSFNDFVVHEGHAYGFDAYTFCCVDLETGARSWKEGRYGHGQVVLLADRLDGKPLAKGAGPYRLVVPGDKRPVRWVKQVVRVSVHRHPEAAGKKK